MESRKYRKMLCLCAAAMLVAVFTTTVNAQGFFSGLPGLPSFGGFFGGSSGCGENLCPKSNLQVYVGWLDGQEGSTISVSTSGTGVGPVRSIDHRFANRGVSIGLASSVAINDSLSFLGTGWYLAPSNTHSREQYNGSEAERTWSVNPAWWYVDGVFAWGSPCTGFKLLAGLRYDYFTARFKNPVNVNGIASLSTDEADATSEGWIPLVGTQYAVSSPAQSLVFRVVGIPALLGNVSYKQTLEGVTRASLKGNYKSGYFLEVFTEYTRSFPGGSAGLFARWNTTKGDSDVTVNANGAITGSDSFDLVLHRNAWTLGGVFALNFDMPF